MEDNSQFKQLVFIVLKKYKKILSTGSVPPKQALETAIKETQDKFNNFEESKNTPNRGTEFLYSVGTGISTSLLYDLGKLLITETLEDKALNKNFSPPGTAPK